MTTTLTDAEIAAVLRAWEIRPEARPTRNESPYGRVVLTWRPCVGWIWDSTEDWTAGEYIVHTSMYGDDEIRDAIGWALVQCCFNQGWTANSGVEEYHVFLMGGPGSQVGGHAGDHWQRHSSPSLILALCAAIEAAAKESTA